MKKPAFSMITAIIFIVIISVVGVSTIQTSQKTLSFAKRTYIKEQAEILFDYVKNVYRYSNFYADIEDNAIDATPKCSDVTNKNGETIFYIKKPEKNSVGDDVYGGNARDDNGQYNLSIELFTDSNANSIYKITVKQIPINNRNDFTKYDACIRHYRVVIESAGDFAKIAKIRLVRDFVLGV